MGSTAITVIAIATGVVAISLAGIIQSYLIEKEKIKADMLVRTEEIRAKNQLEIERLMQTPKSAGLSTDLLDDMGLDKREIKEKQR